MNAETIDREAERVAAQFLGAVPVVEPFPSGGFSGAWLWKVRVAADELCLRCWPPEQPTRERLTFIHRVLRHADRKCSFLPVPRATFAGDTIVEAGERLWQLEPWLPGRADYHADPCDAKLTAAMRALAEFHAAVAEFPLAEPRRGSSQAIADRRSLLDECLTGGMEEVRRGILPVVWPELYEPAQRYFSLFPQAAPRVFDALAHVAQSDFVLQPVIGDVHHDHVLFTGERVTGLVDFGAMRVDHVALDVARLVGSLVGDDDAQRDTAIDVYGMCSHERDLVRIFDSSGTLLSPYRWLRWIFVEGRRFDDRRAVVRRFDRLLTRLAHLLETGGY